MMERRNKPMQEEACVNYNNSDQVAVMERKARSLGRGIGSGAFGYTCRFYLGSPDVTSSRQLPEPHPSTRVERVHTGWSSAPQRHYIDTTAMLPTDSTRCRELENPDIANFSVSV